MAKESSIQWTDATWNIARGCVKVDADCKYCYMYRDSMNSTRYNPLQVIRTKTVFDMPLKLKKPSKIFTCSLTDFFLPEVDAYRAEAWDIIRKCPHHTFQILTKRPERIKQCLPPDWGDGWDNVWIGTSVGSEQAAEIRVPHLLNVPAKIRFLSVEPLLSAIPLTGLANGEFGGWINALIGEDKDHKPQLHLPRIHWVIIGGESGNDNGKYKYRPCDIKWIEQIVIACKVYGTPVFVKQLGTHIAKERKMRTAPDENGKTKFDRHGGNIEEFPEHLRIREFPK